MKDRARMMAPVNTLSLREASARYSIPHTTLSHWLHAGLIRSVARGRRGQPTLLVEADVAALARHYVPGPGRGRRARLAALLLATA
jgi:hypothetical protein